MREPAARPGFDSEATRDMGHLLVKTHGQRPATSKKPYYAAALGTPRPMMI